MKEFQFKSASDLDALPISSGVRNYGGGGYVLGMVSNMKYNTFVSQKGLFIKDFVVFTQKEINCFVYSIFKISRWVIFVM